MEVDEIMMQRKATLLQVALLHCVALGYSPSLLALSEKHLLIIRHVEGQCDAGNFYHTDPKHPNFRACSITDKGRTQLKQLSDQLLGHGFDNRHIEAVYVSPLERAQETAAYLAEVGIIASDKIIVDKRLKDAHAGDREGLPFTDQIKETWLVGSHEAKAHHAESNEDVRARVLKWHRALKQNAPKGHILVITHGIPAMELISHETHNRLKLACGQAYMLPLGDS